MAGAFSFTQVVTIPRDQVPLFDSMSENVFQTCQAEYPDGNQTVLMECISNTLESAASASSTDMRSFLFIVAGAMIFMMQSGFAMLCAGAVRLKNVQNTMLKNLLDACGSAIAFYLVGKCLLLGCSNREASQYLVGSHLLSTL